MAMTCAFLGMGTMGFSMSKNLLAKGFPVQAWNRSFEKAKALEEFGGQACERPSEAVDGADLVHLCLTDGDAVKNVLADCEANFRAGRKPLAVLDHSTIAPFQVLEIADSLKRFEIPFIDAPVTGGDVGAKNGTLTFMVGGDADALEKARPALEAMGKRIFHLGPVGSGQRGKCVNQIACAGAVAAMCEALGFASCLNLNLEMMLEILKSGAAGSWSLENYGPRLLKGDFAPGFLAEHMLKDLKITLREGEISGPILPMTDLLADLYSRLMELVPPGTVGNHGLHLLYQEMNKPR